MTEAEARREVLEQFAALTPHNPNALDPQFLMDIVRPEDPKSGDSFRLEVSFGKRRTSMPIAWDALEGGREQFRQDIARPLAAQLLASA